jgi:hypothetical protein
MCLSCTRVLAIWLCLLTATVVHAQQAPSSTVTTVPRLVRIASTFVPSDGLPPAPVETVTLAIYAEESGGSPLWQETQNVVVNADGRYALLLGATLPEGLPLDLFASGEARWLERRFVRPGEREQARVLLTSVPYALKASDADTLGGRPASAYQLAGPTEGVRAGATTSAGASAKAATASALPLTTGTINYVGKFVTATELGNSAIYDSGGTVGINTTSPLDILHARFTNTNGGLTGYAVQNLGNTATSYSGMLFYDQNGALGQFQGFNNITHEYRINNVASSGSINFMLGGTSRFLVAPTGNIGIGTISPAYPLDITGRMRVRQLGTSPYNNAGIWFYQTTPASDRAFIGMKTDTQIGIWGNTGADWSVMMDTTTGNVGMGGDPLPASRLRVVGNLSVEGNVTGAHLHIDTATPPGNTAVGVQTLQANTTGAENTGVGFQSMESNTSGGINTAVGAHSLQANDSGSFNTAIGYNSLASNYTASFNTAIGFGTLHTNTIGLYNTALGSGADVSLVNLTNATAIGHNALVNASNKIRLGDPFVTVLESPVGLTVISDRNSKEGFRPVDAEEVLRKVAGLPVTTWNYVGHDAKQFRHYGPMAQDFFTAFGHDGVGRIGSETTINSSDLSGVLMLAVEALEKRTTDLKVENAKLKARLEALERSRTEKEQLIERLEVLQRLVAPAGK